MPGIQRVLLTLLFVDAQLSAPKKLSISGNSLHTGRLLYHMCSCQNTKTLDNFITVKNSFALHHEPILQLVDKCTYGTKAFSCIKSSLVWWIHSSLNFKFLDIDPRCQCLLFVLKVEITICLHNSYNIIQLIISSNISFANQFAFLDLLHQLEIDFLQRLLHFGL